MNEIITVKIVRCRNRYLWYALDAEDDDEEKKEYIATIFNESQDKGIVVYNKGFVYHGDYKII